jgi:hypothetical protein
VPSAEVSIERISVALTDVSLSIAVPKGTKHWMYSGIEHPYAYFETSSCEMHITSGSPVQVDREPHTVVLEGGRHVDIVRSRDAKRPGRYEYWAWAQSPESNPEKTLLIAANCANSKALDSAEAMIRSIVFATAPALSPHEPPPPYGD